MLPQKKEQTGLAKYDPVKGLALRRTVSVQQVEDNLNPVELNIFMASTKCAVSEFTDEKLAIKLNELASYVARDVGIMREVEPYQKARFTQIIRTYFNGFSLKEITVAFELALVGELDDYLPKGSDGKADKGHYQQFSVEYITKILNAYALKRNVVVHKMLTALPEPKNEITPEQKLFYENSILDRIAMIYLRYKYTDVFESYFNETLYIKELIRVGLVKEVEVTKDDEMQAVNSIMIRAQKGLLNKFTAEQMTKDKTILPETAKIISYRNAIRSCFDWMIRNEIQILNFLKIRT